MEIVIGFVIIVTIITLINLSIQASNKKKKIQVDNEEKAKRKKIIDFIFSHDGIELRSLFHHEGKRSGVFADSDETSIQTEDRWGKKYALRSVKWVGFVRDVENHYEGYTVVSLESYYWHSDDKYNSYQYGYLGSRAFISLIPSNDNQLAKFKALDKGVCVQYKGTLPKEAPYDNIELRLRNGELLKNVGTIGRVYPNNGHRLAKGARMQDVNIIEGIDY